MLERQTSDTMLISMTKNYITLLLKNPYTHQKLIAFLTYRVVSTLIIMQNMHHTPSKDQGGKRKNKSVSAYTSITDLYGLFRELCVKSLFVRACII